MRKSDLEQIGQHIETVVKKELQPVRDMVLSHNQTLHGTENNPEAGVVNQFGSFKKEVRTKIYTLTGLTNLLTAGITALVHKILNPQ